MKSNYWSPHRCSSWVLLLVAVLSIIGISAVEKLPLDDSRPYLQEKLAAANLSRRAMDTLKAARQQRGLPIDPVTDISGSGLIGEAMSPITSNNGSLSAKQTTVNPNFAAVLVDMLTQAGVKEGDTVAVGFSGSFPAINLNVLAAAETLNLRPIIISSTTASQWGANAPEFTWIDMESELIERGVFRHRSVATSLGGIDDKAVGVPAEGKALLRQAIERNESTFIDPVDYLDSVNQRMALYHRHAAGSPIRAYINVGGGTVSVGTKKGKRLFEPGVNRHKPLGPLPPDSVMVQFIEQDVPVIHLVQIDDLATRYGLPLQPAEIPRVGDGGVYSPKSYNRWMAGGLLAAIAASLIGLGYAERAMPSASVPCKSRRIRPSATRSIEAAEPSPL